MDGGNRGKVLYQVVQDRGKFLVSAFRAESRHLGNGIFPAGTVLPIRDHIIRGVTLAAHADQRVLARACRQFGLLLVLRWFLRSGLLRVRRHRSAAEKKSPAQRLGQNVCIRFHEYSPLSFAPVYSVPLLSPLASGNLPYLG